jgi:hypothetical protein
MVDISPIIPQINPHVQKTQVTDKDSKERKQQEEKKKPEKDIIKDILPENMVDEEDARPKHPPVGRVDIKA